MFFVKIFFIFTIFVFTFQTNVTSFEKNENIFLKKLSNLLDFCVANPQKVDEGTMLGILIAKGQIKYLKDAVEADFLEKKIEVVVENFKVTFSGREIGEINLGTPNPSPPPLKNPF